MSESKEKRGFRRPSQQTSSDLDPVAIFAELRTPAVQFLWAHQDQILREYFANQKDVQDVALELPTGSGKTLVGLLIAEYRRRARSERVIYLCPTKQLVNQVHNLAKAYAINTIPLEAPNYIGKGEYQLGKAIGITTYSAVFNTNPKINDPNCILFDDAHAAEDYIARLWSLLVPRKTLPQLHAALLDTIRNDLNSWAVDIALSNEPPRDESSRVNAVPHPILMERVEQLVSVLDAHLNNSDHRERFPWSMIRNNLHACQMYYSWHEILIRPIVPPTTELDPFALATQRIYMSATLGQAGELERIMGVKQITRVAMSNKTLEHNMGRRLFLFPNRSLPEKEAKSLTVQALKHCKRGLFLAPSRNEATTINARLSSHNINVLGADDIQDSLAPFTAKVEAALVLANRYDGIDLPDEECRLLVLEGLPAGTNLQEKFLLLSLGNLRLFRDRVRTRFTQGVGRCCRSSTDYATVLAIGQEVFDFCAKRENVASMSAELQAEIEFGITNSEGMTEEQFIDLIDLMQTSARDRQEAEEIIKEIKKSKKFVPDPEAILLNEIVSLEIEFSQRLWRKDFQSALQSAIAIVDKLNGGQTQGYKAWWLYLSGCVAWLIATASNDQSLAAKAKAMFGRAAGCSRKVSWFIELATALQLRDIPELSDLGSRIRAEQLFSVLRKLGFTGISFDNEIMQTREMLAKTDATQFELGLEKFGKLLGFESKRYTEQAAPDGVWVVGPDLAFAFEAKSDESADGVIGINTVRQAITHNTWVRDRYKQLKTAEIRTILLSPRTKLSSAAVSPSKDLFYLHISELQKLFEDYASVLRRCRTNGDAIDPAGTIELIYGEMQRSGFGTDSFLKILTSTPLDSVPVES